MNNFLYWLSFIVVAYVVYTFIPSRVRVGYLAMVLLGGIVYAERTGRLSLLKSTVSQLGGG